MCIFRQLTPGDVVQRLRGFEFTACRHFEVWRTIIGYSARHPLIYYQKRCLSRVETGASMKFKITTWEGEKTEKQQLRFESKLLNTFVV